MNPNSEARSSQSTSGRKKGVSLEQISTLTKKEKIEGEVPHVPFNCLSPLAWTSSPKREVGKRIAISRTCAFRRRLKEGGFSLCAETWRRLKVTSSIL